MQSKNLHSSAGIITETQEKLSSTDATAELLQAVSLYASGDFQTANMHFNTAYDTFTQLQQHNDEQVNELFESRRIVYIRSLVGEAGILREDSKFDECINHFNHAIKIYYEQRDLEKDKYSKELCHIFRCTFDVFNSLAVDAFENNLFDDASYYFQRAIIEINKINPTFINLEDKYNALNAKITYADTLLQIDDHKKASLYYRNAYAKYTHLSQQDAEPVKDLFDSHKIYLINFINSIIGQADNFNVASRYSECITTLSNANKLYYSLPLSVQNASPETPSRIYKRMCQAYITNAKIAFANHNFEAAIDSCRLASITSQHIPPQLFNDFDKNQLQDGMQYKTLSEIELSNLSFQWVAPVNTWNETDIEDAANRYERHIAKLKSLPVNEIINDYLADCKTKLGRINTYSGDETDTEESVIASDNNSIDYQHDDTASNFSDTNSSEDIVEEEEDEILDSDSDSDDESAIENEYKPSILLPQQQAVRRHSFSLFSSTQGGGNSSQSQEKLDVQELNKNRRKSI